MNDSLLALIAELYANLSRSLSRIAELEAALAATQTPAEQQ